MGATLYFTDEQAAVTVDFSGTDGYLLDYVPNTPGLRTRDVSVPGVDGADQPVADFDNVSETVKVRMTGSTSTIRTALNKLNRLFWMARQYQRMKNLMPVWLVFKPESGDSLFRSQILNGRVLWDPATLDWMWINGTFDVSVIITRRYFWEANSESEVALSIATGTPSYATGGKTIYDHEDATAGHTNGVEINVDGISGDLGAPPRIELTNTNGSAVAYNKFIVAHEIEHIAAMNVVLEGESATGPANTADAGNSSNDAFGRATWTGTAEADIATWALDNTRLNAAAGKFFRVVMRLANTVAYTDLWLRIKLTASSGMLWQSSKILVSTSERFQDLVTIQLPPYFIGSANLQTVNVVLQATRIAGGSCTLDIDFIHLLPIDGWRKYSPVSGGINQNEVLKDDMISEKLYTLISTKLLSHYASVGAPILLMPGAFKQRLRFLWNRAAGVMTIADTCSVRVYYRARRLTL